MDAGKAKDLIKILLVEDNPADVSIMQEIMQESKMANSLHMVTNGEQAMDFLNRKGEFSDAPRPDLILLDIGLPRKGGLEVLAEVKQDDDLKRIPVIVLTTSRAETDILKSYNLHANSYITKPAHLDELLEIVKIIEEFWFGIVKLPPR